MTKEPTDRQLSRIGDFFKWLSRSEFFIDLSGKGQPVKKLYENDSEGRSQALTLIEKYFKLQKFRYSDESRRYLFKQLSSFQQKVFYESQ